MTAALKHLAELRLSGVLPDLPVQIFVGDYEQPKWWRWHGVGVEVVLAESSPMGRLDLRPLVGLKVCVMAKAWSEPLAKLLDRLKQYACAVELFVIAWIPETIGVRWDRGQSDDWIRIGGPVTGEVE